jgi:hypothetical protein
LCSRIANFLRIDASDVCETKLHETQRPEVRKRSREASRPVTTFGAAEATCIAPVIGFTAHTSDDCDLKRYHLVSHHRALLLLCLQPPRVAK